MIFTDLRFVLLVVGCWVSFFALPLRLRPLVLAVWGAAFYALYAAPLLVVVAALIAITYAASGNRWRTAAITAILTLFVWFKIGESPLVTWLPASARGAAALLVPLGFSYLAFELLHVIIERRRGRLPALTLDGLAAFALFFPCRIAGPIKRYPEFLEAVRAAQPSLANVWAGVTRALFGLVKKVVIADSLALTTAELDYAATPLHVWKALVIYSIQILVDFSAYSDLAIGVSRIFGIAVPENFNWPYFSRNIQEFWTRWHITLSLWARDYVFSPTGRALFKTSLRRSPAVIATLAYLATFLLIGAWHGLTLSFLIWGLYHGLLVAAYYVYRARVPAAIAESRWFQSRAADAAGIALTFLVVTIGWLPFTTEWPRTVSLLKLMAGGH